MIDVELVSNGKALATASVSPRQLVSVEKAQRDRLIEQAIGSLRPREQKILKMRFGLGEYDEHTLAEAGAEIGVGVERARQIEAKAMRKLRHPKRSKLLRSFISCESASNDGSIHV